MLGSWAEMAATEAISSTLSMETDMLLMRSDSACTPASIPNFSNIGFAPAATFL